MNCLCRRCINNLRMCTNIMHHFSKSSAFTILFVCRQVSTYGQLLERSGKCADNEPQSPLSFSTAPMAAYGVATKSWQHHHRNDDIATVPANEGAATAGDAHLVWPSEDAVLAVAEFCERNALLPSALCLHLYPFSSDTAMVCELASKLERGTWPP